MSDLSAFVDTFPKLRVLCVGDVMLDDFIHGEVTRISPEAPVPVFKYVKSVKKLGACGNVISNISSLGASGTLISSTGNDNAGRKISELLGDINCTAALFTADDTPTTVKTRMVCGNQHLFRCDIEKRLSLSENTIINISNRLDEWITATDIVILSDYDKGFLSPRLCNLVISKAKKHNKKILVDPKGDDYSKYSGASLITPNLKEFCQVTKSSVNPTDKNFYDEIRNVSSDLFKRLDIQSLIITLSEHGMIYIPKDTSEQMVHIPTKAHEVFDVTGAGDTAIGVLALSLAAGANIAEAMTIANHAAGIVVGKFGAASVSPKELKGSLISDSFDDDWKIKRKIITIEEASRISVELKASGKKIGFTNGCFDLLHLGHLHSFFSARKQCDVLFVGLNSDNSVKRLKGEDRPVQNEHTRSILLASLETIDYVIVFDEDNAVSLVEAIRPDIIAKQGYSVDNWPEAKRVLEMGGQVVKLEKLEGYSTTSLIARMSN